MLMAQDNPPSFFNNRRARILVCKFSLVSAILRAFRSTLTEAYVIGGMNIRCCACMDLKVRYPINALTSRSRRPKVIATAISVDPDLTTLKGQQSSANSKEFMAL